MKKCRMRRLMDRTMGLTEALHYGRREDYLSTL